MYRTTKAPKHVFVHLHTCLPAFLDSFPRMRSHSGLC
jgi:hypothetical protein